MNTEAVRKRRDYQRAQYWKNIEKSRKVAREKWHRRGAKASNKIYISNDLKIQARYIARGAVRHGRIVKPTNCQRCGKAELKNRIHAHHQDHTKPLEVEWLCSQCHGVESRK